MQTLIINNFFTLFSYQILNLMSLSYFFIINAYLESLYYIIIDKEIFFES